MYCIPKTQSFITGVAIGRKRVCIPCFDGSINYNRVLKIYAPLTEIEGGGLAMQENLKKAKNLLTST